MLTYTITFFDQGGQPVLTEEREAASDDAVIDEVGKHPHPFTIEVHCRNRLVGRCPPLNASWRTH